MTTSLMMTTTTTTSMIPRQCLAPLLLCLLLSAMTAAHQLTPETTTTTTTTTTDNNNDKTPFSDLAAVVLQQTQSMILQLFQQQASTCDHQETELSAVRAELADTKQQLQGLRSDLHSFMMQARDELQDLKNDSRSVAFTARVSRDPLPLSIQQTVVFDDVLTNVGGAYDPQHGIFTAPADGAYVFLLTLMTVNSQGQLYLDVVKNGKSLVGAHGVGRGETNDQGSSQVTLQLSSGDRVWIRNHGGTSVRGGYTAFSGFRLS